jgi:hypothetical protein
MIYLLAPTVTGCTASTANSFCSACERLLRRFAAPTPLDNENAVRLVIPSAKDAAIFLNPDAGTSLSKTVTRMLGGVGQAFPVAMTIPSRRPPDVASSRQSFDVPEFLALRGGELSVDVAGAAFARQILSILQPSISRSRMSLFLSHRRADGGEFARVFWQTSDSPSE